MNKLISGNKAAQKPITAVQFGEGNFLRAFADYMIDIANERGVFDGSVAVVKPIPSGSLEAFARQGNAYTVILRGLQGGQKVISTRIVNAISRVCDPFADFDGYLELARIPDLRFVISNTTEAGITYDETDKFETKPANSFPGKLTQFLFARYEHFGAAQAQDKGLILLPLELIEQSGDKLKDCVKKLIALWGLPEQFARWLDEACVFCNCLVDRIVSGYPASEASELENYLGYSDELMTVGEPFGLWVIESARYEYVRENFPLDKADMPVIFTDNLQPYRERKVRILNGAHTSSVLAAYLAGLDTVGEAMADPVIRPFIQKCVYGEIAPTVPLPADEVKAFADSVMERFENPFIRHELLSISLNSVSKWKARVLPSLKDSIAVNGAPPPCLTFSLAALARFYRGERGDGCLTGNRGTPARPDTYPIKDDANVLDFFAENAKAPASKLVPALLSNTAFWGEDLNNLPGLTARITSCLETIEQEGVLAAIRKL